MMIILLFRFIFLRLKLFLSLRFNKLLWSLWSLLIYNSTRWHYFPSSRCLLLFNLIGLRLKSWLIKSWTRRPLLLFLYLRLLLLIIWVVIINRLTRELSHVIILNFLPRNSSILFGLLIAPTFRHVNSCILSVWRHKLCHYSWFLSSIALLWLFWDSHRPLSLFLLKLIDHAKVMRPQRILLNSRISHFCLLMFDKITLFLSLLFFFHFLLSSHLLHRIPDGSVLDQTMFVFAHY